MSNWPSKFTSNDKRGRYHRPQYIFTSKRCQFFPTKILKNVIFILNIISNKPDKHMHLHNIRVQFFRTKINVDNSKEFRNVDLTKILYLIIDFMIYPLPTWSCNLSSPYADLWGFSTPLLLFKSGGKIGYVLIHASFPIPLKIYMWTVVFKISYHLSTCTIFTVKFQNKLLVCTKYLT